jgi:hypothetical protein
MPILKSLNYSALFACYCPYNGYFPDSLRTAEMGQSRAGTSAIP